MLPPTWGLVARYPGSSHISSTERIPTHTHENVLVGRKLVGVDFLLQGVTVWVARSHGPSRRDRPTESARESGIERSAAPNGGAGRHCDRTPLAIGCRASFMPPPSVFRLTDGYAGPGAWQRHHRPPLPLPPAHCSLPPRLPLTVMGWPARSKRCPAPTSSGASGARPT
jgi:hypothetical protein